MNVCGDAIQNEDAAEKMSGGSSQCVEIAPILSNGELLQLIVGMLLLSVGGQDGGDNLPSPKSR